MNPYILRITNLGAEKDYFIVIASESELTEDERGNLVVLAINSGLLRRPEYSGFLAIDTQEKFFSSLNLYTNNNLTPEGSPCLPIARLPKST